MYRAPSLLGRQSILRTRSHVNHNNSRGLLEKHHNVGKSNASGRRFNSSEEGAPKAASSVLTPVLGLLGAGVGVTTIGAALNDSFRETVENNVPGSSALFGVVLPGATKPVVDDLPSLLPVKKPAVELEVVVEQAEVAAVEVKEEAPPEELVVVPSDEEPAIEPAPSDVVAEVTEVVEEAATEVVSETAVEALPETVVEAVQEPVVEAVPGEEVVEAAAAVDEQAVDVPTDVVVSEESVAPAQPPAVAEEPVAESVAVVEEPEYVVVETTPEITNEEAAKLALQQEIQRNTQILTTEYENLRIILEDTITTKSSAVRMLHGYISQFSQALLVVRDDPAYASIWEAIMAVGHSIQESMDLVKIKETEVQGQVQNINSVMSALRTHGSSEVADNAEQLITSSHNQLSGCQTEITALNKTVEILAGLRTRIEASPDRLQNYLRGFIPDLMKLLSTKDLATLESMSVQDALLLLSLQRPSLVYAEQEVKDAEKEAEFQVVLEQRKLEVWKEAELHLANVLEQVSAEKSEEFNTRVQELNQQHEVHLLEELHAQEQAHQQLLVEENAKLEAELAAQHIVNVENKLKEKQAEHEHELETNLSSLNAIESKIGDVLDMEKKAQKNKQLWAAAQAISSSLDDVAKEGRTKKLAAEIPKVLQCDEADPLLAQIVSAVPERAASDGVVPEIILIMNLKEKKKLCKKVAAVRGADDGFFQIAASIIKSYCVPSKTLYYGPLPDDADIEKLSPYEILEHADYYATSGDLERAATLICQLNSAGRVLLEDWVKEVRLLLETKQAANLLMAYVSSLVVGLE